MGALALYLGAAEMPSPSWRQSGACGVYYSHSTLDCQCLLWQGKPWKDKEIVVGTYTRSGVVGGRGSEHRRQISRAEYGEKLSSDSSPGPVGGPEGMRTSGCCVGLKEQPSLSLQGLTQSPENAETNPEGNSTHSSSLVVRLLSDLGCFGEGNSQ